MTEGMQRAYNFNPGPAALPLEVLEQAQEEFVAYGGERMSLLEMSHRSKTVERINEEAQSLLLELLGIRKGYSVLFMGGGASMQFALLPTNLLTANKVGRYILSGSFSEKALAEAQMIGAAEALASGKDSAWSRLPDLAGIAPKPDTAYVHMTTNNTIEGSRFNSFPDMGEIPLAADMTSDILSRELDMSQFALIYAGAQKNLGLAGVTVVVARDDLLAQCAKRTIPTIFNYAAYAQHRSLYNTPPVHAIYMLKLVLEWTKKQGSIAKLEKRNEEKAALLYDVIDASGGFYQGIVEKPYRSDMNVTWRMNDEETEKRFVKQAERHGFAGLAGHRSVGGLRASAYNAVTFEACKALADLMQDFQQRNG